MTSSSQSIPRVDSNLNWLALQDQCRRRAQVARLNKLGMHFLAFVVTLLMPLAQAVATANGAPVNGGIIVACMAFAVVVIELIAMRKGERSSELNVLSRMSLAWALPAGAFKVDASPFQFNEILKTAQPDVTQASLDATLADPATRSNFETWWRTSRGAGEARLRAMLLENVVWTVEILRSSEKRRRLVWTVLLVSFVASLVIGVLVSPKTAQGISAVVLAPTLSFLLAATGSGLIGNHHTGLRELESLRTALRGSDTWAANNQAAAWSLFAVYLALTSHMPPLPSHLYDAMQQELNASTSDQALDDWLQART